MDRIEIIDEAIAAHQLWVDRFHQSLEASVTSIEPEQVRGDRACALGKWLHNPGTDSLLGKESLSVLIVIHQTFHEIAYQCARLMKSGAPSGEVEGLVQGLANLSGQIVSLLELSKKHISSALA